MDMKELHLGGGITIKIPIEYELQYADVAFAKQSDWPEGSSNIVTEVHYRVKEEQA